MQRIIVPIPDKVSSSLPDTQSTQSPHLNQDVPVTSPNANSATTSVSTISETPINFQNGITSTTQTTPANTTTWSTSLQNVLDQPPSALPRWLMLGGLAFGLAFSAWAILGQIDEVGHAQGRLVPKGETYKINPVESGKVANMSVKEGQAVKAGQVLFELDTQLAANEVDRLQQQIASGKLELIQKQALIERTHLEAETRKAIADADVQAATAAIAQANAKATATKEQLTELKAGAAAGKDRLERLQPLSATVQERRTQLEADARAAKEQVDKLKPLVQSGAIAQKQLWDAEQAMRDRQGAITRSQLEEGTTSKERLFEAEQAVRDRQSSISKNIGELQQTLAQINQLQAGWVQKQAEGRRTQIEAIKQTQQLEVEMTQLKAKVASDQNLLDSAKAKLQQRYLYAPVDGVVSSLNIRNIGEVVQPGQTVAEIAADKAPLILVASLPNREAGFVKTGMPVQIKLDAYPYQDYGIVSGKVITTSSDAKTDQQLGSTYRVEVALDRNYVTADRKAINFKAGQTATADIIIRRRRIADLLLDPIGQLQKGGINL